MRKTEEIQAASHLPGQDGSCRDGFRRVGDMCVKKGAFLTESIDRDAHQHAFVLDDDLTEEVSGHDHLIMELGHVEGVLVGLTNIALNPLTGIVHRHSINLDSVEKAEDIQKPFPNEHAARLQSPGKFDPDTFRRAKGGTIFGSINVPKTIGIIWAKLKTDNEIDDFPLPQSLRFPTKNWSVSEAKAWLKDNDINFTLFEEAEKTEKTMKNTLQEAMTKEVGKVLKANENTNKEDIFLELSGVMTSEDFGHTHKIRLMVKEGLVIGETIEDATGHMHKFQFKIDSLGAVDGQVDIAANVDNILHVHRLKIEPRSETFPFEQMSEFPENVAKKISDNLIQKGIVRKVWIPSEGAQLVELNFWGLKFATQQQVGDWLALHDIQAAIFQLGEFEFIARTAPPKANYSFVKMVDVEAGVMATITSKTDPWA